MIDGLVPEAGLLLFSPLFYFPPLITMLIFIPTWIDLRSILSLFVVVIPGAEWRVTTDLCNMTMSILLSKICDSVQLTPRRTRACRPAECCLSDSSICKIRASYILSSTSQDLALFTSTLHQFDYRENGYPNSRVNESASRRSFPVHATSELWLW